MKPILALLLFVPIVVFSQHKLEKAKEDLKQKTTVKKTSSSNVRIKRGNSTSTTNNDSYFENILLEIGFKATLGLAFGQAQERDLNPYPYFYDNEGEYAAVISNTGRKQGLKLGVNYVFNRVKGFELNAVYKPIPILAIEASHLHFSEKNSMHTNMLGITSVMANYHRIRTKDVSLWWGVGATYVGSSVNTIGFAYTFGTEIYPIKPISLHISWKESFINENDIDVFKSQLKYHIKNKAFFIGYHHFLLGNETINGIAFGAEFTL